MYWSSTKRTSSISSYQKLACSRHDMAEKIVYLTLTHSKELQWLKINLFKLFSYHQSGMFDHHSSHGV